MSRIKKLSLLLAFIFLHGIGFSQSYYYAFDERSDLTRMEEDILIEFPSAMTTNDVETWATNNNIFGPNTQIFDLLNNQFLLREIVNNTNHSFVDGYSNGDLVRIKSGLWMGEPSSPKAYYANRITLKVKDGQTYRDILNGIIQNYGLTQLETTSSYEAYDVGAQDALTIANIIQESGATVYSTPDFFMEVEAQQYIPSDPFFQYQWGFHNYGQALQNNTPGTLDADIDAPEAWDFTKGSSSITVAVIDDGVMANHPDLPLSRQVRLPGSNFVAPYDFSNPNDPEPASTGYHGTPCAGLIAAEMDNIGGPEGIAGLAPHCKIMPIRIALSQPAPVSILANSIDFAWTNGADVISISWGWGPSWVSQPMPGHYYSNPNLIPSIVTAINNAVTYGRNPVQNQTIGSVVVIAAGNYAWNGESDPASDPGLVGFPANVLIPGVLTVGASDKNDMLAIYSPMGNSTPGQQIDVTAPSHGGFCFQTFTEAENVWSTDNYTTSGPENGLNPWPNSTTCNWLYYPASGSNYLAYTGHFGGTSAAAPEVAGLAALILSMSPTMDQMSVFNNITCSAQDVGGYNYVNSYWGGMGYGRINAFNSIMNLCIPNYTVNWPIPAGQYIKYQAANFIIANSTINSAPNTRMDDRAGDYVLMQPGFSAPNGSTYLAYIAPCTACVTDGATKNMMLPNEENNDERVSVNKSDFKLYPNPADNQVTFAFSLNEKATGKIRITDVTGRMLQTINLYEGTTQTQLDLTAFDGGTYLVNFYESEKLMATKKLVVNK